MSNNVFNRATVAKLAPDLSGDFLKGSSVTDLVKFHHFGKVYQSLAIFLNVNFFLGKVLS